MPAQSYAQRRAASLLLPPVDLRHLLSPDVRDQGPRPLCVPFSTSVAHEAAKASSSGSPAECLAVESLWQDCVHQGAAGHDGTTINAVSHAMSQTGQTAEALWPYNDALGAGTEPTPASAVTGSFNTADLFAVPLAHDGIEDDVEATLTVGLPLVLVIELTAEFENPDINGEIDVPALSAPGGDYHAVAVVGAATDTAGDARRLLVRNSWGVGWGAGGYGWLPYDYLIAFAGQAAAIDPMTLAIR